LSQDRELPETPDILLGPIKGASKRFNRIKARADKELAHDLARCHMVFHEERTAVWEKYHRTLKEAGREGNFPAWWRRQ
jgi:hypothetical protein